MNALILQYTPTGWQATYAGPWADAAHIAFGSATVPLLGFKVAERPSVVMVVMQRLMPEDVVITIDS